MTMPTAMATGKRIPALSILQPWVRCIFEFGKRVENRKWKTTHKGPLLIHASMSAKENQYWLKNAKEWKTKFGFDYPSAAGTIYGAILGVVRVVGCIELDKFNGRDKYWQEHAKDTDVIHCIEAMNSNFASGPFCWILADAKPFRMPIPAKGNLGLWQPDEVTWTMAKHMMEETC